VSSRAAWSPLVATLIALACGTNVDLGGSYDAGRDSGMTCPVFVGPSTSAPCDACDPKSKTCQPNGCFNGYLCDIAERDCKAPGTPCSGSGS
jgi:hypothetical protein